MDFYKFHSNPETLYGFERANDIVPERIYNKAIFGNKLSNVQEDILAKNPKCAYRYALLILKKPFPKGEDVISKDPRYAYHYAYDVLKNPFPKGEDAIAENPAYAILYALNVLKLPTTI